MTLMTTADADARSAKTKKEERKEKNYAERNKKVIRFSQD